MGRWRIDIELFQTCVAAAVEGSVLNSLAACFADF